MKRIKPQSDRWYTEASPRMVQLRYNAAQNMLIKAKLGIKIPNGLAHLKVVINICVLHGAKCKK